MRSWQFKELLYALLEITLFIGITMLLFEGTILVLSNILNICVVVFLLYESWC